eukprot:TRINITY_DN9435_c0_g1_i1.p1 TRINITY_DN9435_c0_g1~~TRINITY_DN9435_c0_g1_i1.p1  ORF type:complete len:454 (-),score=63.50 TRINITY_DN9435_c0_g1_i1:169-1530(-)
MEIITATISLYFIGRLDDVNLQAGVGLGQQMVSGFGYGVLFSLNAGMESMSAQAFGNRDYKLMSVYFHKALVCQVLVQMIVGVVMWNAQTILLTVGYEEVTCEIAAEYIRAAIPSIVSIGFFDCIKTYFHAQNIFGLQLYVSVICTITHFIYCHIFIDQLRLGATGAAFAKSITDLSALLFLITLARLKGIWIKSWFPITMKSFTGLGRFFRVTVVMGIVIFVEYISFDLYTFQVGFLKNAEALAAQVILANIYVNLYMFPFGIATTSNAYVANAVGEGFKHKAVVLAKTGIVFNFGLTLVFMGSLFFMKDIWIGLFTTSPQIHGAVDSIFPIFLATMFFDFYQTNLVGVLRGLNKEKYTAVCQLTANFAIGQVITYYVGVYKGLGLWGVWLGFITPAVILTILYSLGIVLTSWDREIQKVQRRMALDAQDIITPIDTRMPEKHIVVIESSDE